MNAMLSIMLQCGADQAETLKSAYRDESGWHAEAVIAAADALLGHAIQSSAYSMAGQGTGAVVEFEHPTNPPFGKFINFTERIQICIDNEFVFFKAVAEQLGWFAPGTPPARCNDRCAASDKRMPSQRLRN